MHNLNSEQLKKLHSDFIKYRDEECGGFYDISVNEFYKSRKSNYKEVKLNQCDGCARNLPIVSGLHRDSTGRPVMTCCAGLYA